MRAMGIMGIMEMVKVSAIGKWTVGFTLLTLLGSANAECISVNTGEDFSPTVAEISIDAVNTRQQVAYDDIINVEVSGDCSFTLVDYYQAEHARRYEYNVEGDALFAVNVSGLMRE